MTQVIAFGTPRRPPKHFDWGTGRGDARDLSRGRRKETIHPSYRRMGKGQRNFASGDLKQEGIKGKLDRREKKNKAQPESETF